MEQQKDLVTVSGITIDWNLQKGVCHFADLPVTMMWIDTTLAGLMAGVQAMVGTERFALAMQSEGRKSIEADWQVISNYPDFQSGFETIANIATVAGWGKWEVVEIDLAEKKCVFRMKDSWEGKYQKTLGVCWGCGMLAGKLAGYCSKLFGSNCWAEQTSFTAEGDEYDTFHVGLSDKTIEREIENLLLSDEASRADMAVALQKLHLEIKARTKAEAKLLRSQQELEYRVEEQTRALKKSEYKYRQLIENTEDLLTSVDADGNFVFVNHAAKRIFGISPEECIGQAAFQFCHPEDRERTINWFRDCLAKHRNRASIENRQVNQTTGEVFTLFWASSFEYDDSGKLLGTGGIARDITEIRLVERNYQNLFEKMLDGFALHEIICDSSGNPVDYRFLSANPAFEKLTGLKAADLLGRTVLEIMPDTEKHWIETYGQVALTGEPITFENYSQELDKHFEVTAYRPAKNQFACIFQDTTLKKKNEEARKALENQLRQSQKMEAIGTLAGGIAHDFNNILAAILGYADMAKDEISEFSPAKYQIEQVLLAGNRAKDLVKHILSFSRKELHSKKPVQIAVIVSEAVQFLRATIPTTIEITVSFDEQCGTIMADPTQIHQVIVNLCTNAYQAIGDDGGVMEVSLSMKEVVEVDKRDGMELRPGKYVVLSVKDNGPGIESKIIDRIFDPYFTTKEVGKGSGMGLAVVHGIMKSHDGIVTVDSKLGSGTIFSAIFPAIEAIAIEESQPAGVQPRGKEKILVVDDEESIVDLTKRMLERLGYMVTSQTDSLVALEVFRSKPEYFDLVISDQTMPKLNGAQLAKEIMQIRSDMPIILCTGYSSKIDDEKARSLGIKAFAMKPVRLAELARLIRQVLDD